MKIHPLQDADLHLVRALQPAGWPDILPIIRFYLEAPFCYPVKVISGNSIVGIGTVIEHKGTAWLAHIIVHPDYRKQGIGTYITQTLIDITHAKGITTIYLIASDLGEPVYKKSGFEAEAEYLLYKDMPSVKWPVSPQIIAANNSHKQQIALLDRLASGEDRMFHLERYLNTGYVYLQDNIVEGFYIPDWGEGLIIANTADAGTALMKLRFTMKSNAAFPSANKDAIACMHHHGVKSFQTIKRMRIGPERPWQPQYIYNRIRGNLG